jgi:hypothetical protein
MIYIYESEVQAIVGEAQRFPNSETGGDLFGTFTHGNMPVIWLASGPGPNAKHLPTHFEQDVRFTSEWQRRLMNEFGIQYVGSWHSHHKLSLNHPSGGDAEAARNYAVRHHRQRTLEIIANHEGRRLKTFLRPYFYPNAQEADWTPATFSTLTGESPLRARLGRDEAVFSAGLDWKRIPSKIYSLSSYKPTREFAEIPYADAESEFPSELETAIQNLRRDGIEVEQRGEVLMVIIPIVNDDQVLAVAVQSSQDLSIIQVNLIDYALNSNTNVTERLREAGIPLALNNSGETLAQIVSVTERLIGDWRT